MSQRGWVVALVGVVLVATLAGPAWARQGKMDGGDPPDDKECGGEGQPLCPEPGGGGIDGPVVWCQFQTTFEAFIDCLTSGLSAQLPFDVVPVEEGGEVVGYRFDDPFEEVTSMCFREVDPDIQEMHLSLDTPELKAWIRKVDEFPPQGGTITISLSRAGSVQALNVSTTGPSLNQRILTAINNAGFTAAFAGDFIVVTAAPGGGGLTHVGFKSTDAGIIKSEIALILLNPTFETDCSP